MLLRRVLVVSLLVLLIPAGAAIAAERPSAAKAARTYRNPIIDRIGPADPHVIRHEGTYFLYPTTDGKGYDVFVSKDLVRWEQKPKCFTDASGGSWVTGVFHDQKGAGECS